MKLSLIIPCYNEEGNVTAFYEECKKSLSNIKRDVELIFVNDGSKDKTKEELDTLLKKKTKFTIKVINFSRNFGKEAAMYAGLKNADLNEDDYLAIIDADLQQPPELLLQMIQVLDNCKEYDEVCYFQEARIEGKFTAFLKNKFYKVIGKASRLDFVDGASDFRMFRSFVVESILSLSEHNRFSKGIFIWVGFNTKYLPYTPEERLNGQSSFNMKSLFKYAISGILSFSIAPIRFVTYSGILFSSVSIISLLVAFIRKIFFEINISMYSIIIMCLFLLGGIILFALGIIGEYIARIYTEVKNRPIYIAREVLSNKDK